MDRHLKKTKKVRLNQFGLDRVNEARRQKGIEPLDIRVAQDGHEVLAEGESDDGGLAGGFDAAGQPVVGGALPARVDNSSLPSFPPVRSQGSIGSCASFSTTYYAATHMLGLARGFNNKNDADNATKLSPKWTYPMVNGGQDSGSWFSPTFEVLLRHGAASWTDWPYSGQNTPSSYREWCRDGAVWRRAIASRMAEAGTVYNVHTAAGLNDVKTLLANGYVLLYATDIFGWQYTTISDDPASAEDQAFLGKRICYYVAAVASGHAMTVVGYNDHLWCDINKNGVVDNGERGALRICNSWGSDWLPGNAGPADGGFTWLAYDALRSVSAVFGANTPNRAPGGLGSERTPWWYNQAYWLTARPAYTPRLLAQFTLNHSARSQMQVGLGRSTTTLTVPSISWTPGALQNQGGAFAFDGTLNAVSGTFVADLSDLALNGLNRYYLVLTDGVFGSPGSISEFKLTDANGVTLATATAGVPNQADGSTALAYVNHSFNPPTILNGGSTNIPMGVAFAFTIQASGSPTGFGAAGLPPGLTLNPAIGVISGTPSQPGVFVVNLSASNPNGTGSGTLTITVGSSVVTPPTISSASTATGTVGIPFSYAIAATGSPTGFGASGLPAGLSVSTGTGVISGTPTQPGTFFVQLSAINSGGTGSRSLTLVINPPPAAAPVITSPLMAQAQAGSPFTYRIIAANNPLSFAADGLPQELSVNAASGLISGTLALARDYTITLRASNGAGTGYATLLLSVQGDSSFGPANDAFANRTLLQGTNVTGRGGNNNATAESLEPAHAGNPASRSVWWTWTAPAAGVATISTVGSDFDTVLAVYSGAHLSLLSRVAQDDESGGDHASRVQFNATTGRAYAIVVDGYAGAIGNITLHVSFSGTPPQTTNDAFVNSTLLTTAGMSVSGRNAGATAEPGEPAHAGVNASHSVWWRWTAPDIGVLRVNTIGSDFDTVLAVYTGVAVNQLTPLASDDEGGGLNTSALVLNVTAGTTYRIAVDGYQGATGDIVLTFQFMSGRGTPLNDDFANRQVLSGPAVTATGANSSATRQPGEPAHAGQSPTASVWWTWTAPASGLVTLDTSGSSFDTMLAVYVGSSLGNLTGVAGNDDVDGLLTSRVTFPATAGTAYQVAVDGFAGANGNIVLHLNALSGAPANDQLANGAVLVGTQPSAVGANVNATAQAGEPNHAGSLPGRSVWWFWTAPGHGRMTFSTAGSSFDTRLAVYTGGFGSALNHVASADDTATDVTSTVAFWADAGITYRIAVDGFLGAAGNIFLSGNLAAAGDVLYATDFESFGYGADRLVGADGWLGVNLAAGVQGIISAFTGQGLGGYLGYNPSFNSPVNVYRPVNFQPIAQGRPVVTFVTTLAIVDSDNGRYDSFAFSVFNRSGLFLAGILFNNDNLGIFYDNRSGGLLDTGLRFQNGVPYVLAMTMDYAANSWSATLNGAVLFTNRTFHAGGLTRDLGLITLDWYLFNAFAPGNNYLIFDNLTLAASPAPSPPVITLHPQSRTNNVGSLASFQTVATSTTPLRYQWQFGGINLPGATNATLTLLNVTSPQAGAYRVLVSNAAGSALSQLALLTVVNVTEPLRLSGFQSAPRGFGFRIDASPGRSYVVEASTNLTAWTPLSTVTMDALGTAFYLDPASSNRARGFYRVRTIE